MRASLIRARFVGFGLLPMFLAGCEPASTNSLAEFSLDFVRSLTAALLL